MIGSLGLEPWDEDAGLAKELACGHFDHNDRSRRVVEKCGFVFLKKVVTPTAWGIHETGKMYVLYNPNKVR